MRLRQFAISCLVLSFVFLFAPLPKAAPQEKYDRGTYAREYVQFLVQELSQWTKGFPNQFYSALLQPPRDSSKLSEGAKAGPSDLGDSVNRWRRLAAPKTSSPTPTFGPKWIRRWPRLSRSIWPWPARGFPILCKVIGTRSGPALNSLAEIYKFDTLATLEAPGAPGRGRGGQAPAAATVAVALPPGAVAGYHRRSTLRGPRQEDVDRRHLCRTVCAGWRQSGAGDRGRESVPNFQPG